MSTSDASHSPVPRPSPPPAPESFPERLGDFQLLERLGGGGMGVVYLARQDSLGRFVALKLVHPEHLYFPGARERFLREVEATARLQHPGIVPIYTFGEEKGVPYFAMERVVGCTLAEALHTLGDLTAERLSGSDLGKAVTRRTTGSGPLVAAMPTPMQQAIPPAPLVPLFNGSFVEAALRIARQVAEALTHAHARGVLHRDVKPSNVMLTPDGRVLLLDFGLATAEGVSKLTRTGTILGSLPYLAPEHLAGNAPPAPTSDVYSLGVTLYEMLALQLPFRGESVDELRTEILAGRPASIRAGNDAIPSDVETVCFTAMERDPARRYASAAAFAQDLDNLLRLRPIQARRASSALRARRWAQRHPTRTVALLLGGAILLGGPIAYGVLQQRSIEKLKAEQGRTAREKERAVTNFRAVLAAIDRILERVEDSRLDDVAEVAPLRRDIYAEALATYQGFRGEEANDPQLRADSGRNRRQLGEMLSQLGRATEAETAFLDAIDLFDRLLHEKPDDAEIAAERGRTLGQLALVELEMGRGDDAVGHATAMRDAFVRLEARDPDDVHVARQVIDACVTLSLAHIHRGDADAALESAATIAPRATRLLSRAPGQDELAQFAALSLVRAGSFLAALGRPQDAEGLFARAEELLAPIVAQPEFAYDMDQTRAELAIGRGDAAVALDHVVDAARFRTEAVDRLRALFTRHPERMRLRSNLATALSNFGQLKIEVDEPTAAAPLLEEAVKLLAEAQEIEPDVAEHAAKLCATRTNLGVAKLDARLPKEALRHLERAAEDGRRFRELSDDDPRGVIYGISALSYLAEAQLALKMWEEVEETASELEKLAPDDVQNQKRVVRIREMCALGRSGR